jgi:saccharopine dehydrogenase-like NADP-dependent oxidoreductase
MKQVLLFGAGKSATVLIDYLLSNARTEQWKLVVVDANLQLAKDKLNNSPHGQAVSFDVTDVNSRHAWIQKADIVISMLPPALHLLVAKDCIQFSKHLLTASYIDNDLKEMETIIRDKNILFLCEMGLDPGIDHMSAMKLVDEINENGGKITSFQSHCGGLIAPESDDNPWHYKISWNPRNIVLAGKAGAHYRENGEEKKIRYEELFNGDNIVNVPDIGYLSWYPNRDSLSYTPLYGLQDAPTFVRTTLRHPDFMYGWKNIIDLKLTDETVQYNTDDKSLSEVFREHMDKNGFGDWLQKKISERVSASKDMEQNQNRGTAYLVNTVQEANLILKQLFYLGLDDNETKVNKGMCSPADILQFAIERKLALKPEDKDMIVMLHEIEYENGNSATNTIRSTLIVKGENSLHTAMAKTVGLPLGIATKLILNGGLKIRGLHIPTSKEIYEPVLKELEEYGIRFEEE